MTQPSSDAKPLVLTQGDPAGVGPAATLLAWRTLRDNPSLAFYVRGAAAYLERERVALGDPTLKFEIISTPDEAARVFPHAVPLLETGTACDVLAGVPSPESANDIILSIETAVSDVVSGQADAVVTNPIAKSLLYAAGFRHPGHTEFLAYLAGVHFGTNAPRPVMLLVGGGLKVALATIHTPLKSVPEILTSELIEDIATIMTDALRRDFGIASPVVGVCGLNPHAGEDGTIGREDLDIIAPAVTALNSKGIRAIGPRPGDTIFHEALEGQFDAVLAMYHDQGLIPVKTLDLWGGVNVTIGLPFIRTSPDHGTGYDAAAHRQVRPDSLIAAIRLARSMADNRRKFRASHD